MNDRIYKINELIREQVSELILKEVADHDGFITVTAVETTPDLRYSTIWYSVIGAKEDDISKLLVESEKGIQKILNSRLNLKRVPKIGFRVDKSGDYANKINHLIEEANKGEQE